jgi:hypothetical protein
MLLPLHLMNLLEAVDGPGLAVNYPLLSIVDRTFQVSAVDNQEQLSFIDRKHNTSAVDDVEQTSTIDRKFNISEVD